MEPIWSVSDWRHGRGQALRFVVIKDNERCGRGDRHGPDEQKEYEADGGKHGQEVVKCGAGYQKYANHNGKPVLGTHGLSSFAQSA